MKFLCGLLVVVTASGCAGGRMVCEWQTDDDRYVEIVEKVLESYDGNAKEIE